jgi:hypothetical protein
MFPWSTPFAQKPKTPREVMLDRLREGVPPELVARAAGVPVESFKNDPETDKALAEGEILLFERARDSGVTGAIRAAMRREANSWMPKAEVTIGLSLEDYLKD